MSFARVALDLPLAREFDYHAGDAGPDDIGRRVTVPFGNKRVVGILLALHTQSSIAAEKLKRIETIHRETPALPAESLAFLRFCARYYHHPLGQVLLQALPPGLRKPAPWRPRTRKAGRRTQPEAENRRIHTLTGAQQSVVDAVLPGIRQTAYAVWLLQGVTGSGKTEVYLALAEQAIAAGRKVLLLVPEINLTPQLEARVHAHFPQVPVVALHSELPGVARVENWLQAGRPGPMVIVGTRLAVLGPLPDLGLVVVDEEHDASYKQQEGLRYSARDLAVVRGRDAGCPVVLGSATPSLESLAQVQRGRYGLLCLDQRADPRARLPGMTLLDLRSWPAPEGLAQPALQALRETLQRGEQSLVFINRRGYAPSLWCGECGWIAGCPRCSGRLVVHLRARQARCHLCGWQQAIVRHCPDCGNADLKPAGEGTQKLERTLQAHLPEARILRVDADTVSGRGQFAAVRCALLDGQADIAVGTQMLSKGHDFPALTCVVVVNADAALFSADFRASERLLAQLLQVAGRAGRAERPGQVLIQTSQPAHPLFQALLRQDYRSYAEVLLEERRLCGFPPQAHQAVLHASALQAEPAERFLHDARALCPPAEHIEVFDPVPAAIARVANRYRFQLLVQATDRTALQSFLGAWMARVRELPGSSVLWVLDVDPLDV